MERIAINRAKPDLRTTIDRDLFDQLRRYAQRRGVPMSAIVERALAHYFAAIGVGKERKCEDAAPVR